MGTIGLDRILFTSALVAMEISACGINVTSDIWEAMGENSKVFDFYLAEYMHIQTIFQKYRELALRDVGEIRKIGNNVIKVDQKLIDIWK